MKLELQLMSDCENILIGFSVLHASSTLTAWRLNILQLFHRKMSDSLVGLGFQVKPLSQTELQTHKSQS